VTAPMHLDPRGSCRHRQAACQPTDLPPRRALLFQRSSASPRIAEVFRGHCEFECVPHPVGRSRLPRAPVGPLSVGRLRRARPSTCFGRTHSHAGTLKGRWTSSDWVRVWPGSSAYLLWVKGRPRWSVKSCSCRSNNRGLHRLDQRMRQRGWRSRARFFRPASGALHVRARLIVASARRAIRRFSRGDQHEWRRD
jgi:hypothetical protein